VVCCGQLTRLASYITAFDKTYDAVIEFGNETDTLEWTGSVVKTAPLPTKAHVEEAVAAHTGALMQTPPLFSALHIHGERASDIARSGRKVELLSRAIIVYGAEIREFLLEDDDNVRAVRVMFSVSKGTYIRSLARDIGTYCKSAAHLAGLRRISVGDFVLEDAVGAHLLKPFTIASVYEEIAGGRNASMHNIDETELHLQHCVCEKIQPMSETLAAACGFAVLHIQAQYETDFLHGRQLSEKMFVYENSITIHKTTFFEQCAALRSAAKNHVHGEDKKNAEKIRIAIFTERGTFLGMIEKKVDGAYAYVFVGQ
ncbi:MAG: hypothetical protein IJR50_09535, partial [Treponema sp.]|nr:hypothetical protein [Treponema sp.]